MTTLNLHEVFVMTKESSNTVIAVYESKEEAEKIAEKATKITGIKFKIENAAFFGKLPM